MPEPATALPSLYIPHGGGPCFFMKWTWGPPDTWDRMGAWLRGLGTSLGAEPSAVLVISAHWEAARFTLTGNGAPALIYDYEGFPAETYRLRYGAPGDPALAERVAALLSAAGLPAGTDPVRGFDHGVFIPFLLIYPEARIPIIQLSLKAGLDPALHLAAGRALAPLRRAGVLIVGSGMSYHNMRAFGSDRAPGSDTFDAWLTETVEAADPVERDDRLAQWQRAPAARTAHPREEHLLPLMVAAGAGGGERGRRIFTDRVLGATVSAYAFGG